MNLRVSSAPIECPQWEGQHDMQRSLMMVYQCTKEIQQYYMKRISNTASFETSLGSRPVRIVDVDIAQYAERLVQLSACEQRGGARLTPRTDLAGKHKGPCCQSVHTKSSIDYQSRHRRSSAPEVMDDQQLSVGSALDLPSSTRSLHP